MKLIRIVPKPPPQPLPTYDIRGLTRTEIAWLHLAIAERQNKCSVDMPEAVFLRRIGGITAATGIDNPHNTIEEE